MYIHTCIWHCIVAGSRVRRRGPSFAGAGWNDGWPDEAVLIHIYWGTLMHTSRKACKCATDSASGMVLEGGLTPEKRGDMCQSCLLQCMARGLPTTTYRAGCVCG